MSANLRANVTLDILVTVARLRRHIAMRSWRMAYELAGKLDALLAILESAP